MQRSGAQGGAHKNEFARWRPKPFFPDGSDSIMWPEFRQGPENVPIVNVRPEIDLEEGSFLPRGASSKFPRGKVGLDQIID